ncbi:MAG: sensor histidine kinase [Acidobacteria bacterium]|nr:sensor histidine kinase [Acidobacteriota bacterium]
MRLPTSTIRGALVAGFAVVFALWLASGYELIRSIRAADQQMASSRRAFARGEQVLSTLTSHVLLGSIYLRDALMDPSPDAREHYRQELTQIRRDVDEALPEYLPLVDTPLEREQWDRLQLELGNYWKSREVAFTMEARPDAASSAASVAIIRGRLVPARESILQIVNSLSALERTSIENHEQEMARFFQTAQTRVVTLASLALLAGLVVAFVAARHVGRLQVESERQRRAEQQNRRDLERLSARLVTAQEEERRSLARELHDAVGQALTAIKMEMGVALRGGTGDARARTALEQARAIAETTLQNVRDLSQLLHPSMLDDFGLPEALGAHLRSFSRRTSIRAQLTHERMEDRLPPDIEVCVYRIVQEALTNVARHSGASSCTVALVRREDILSLTIEDDGSGISPAVVRTPDVRRGLGLIGMRERAQALTGSFVIENRLEGGTRVMVRLPVPPAAEDVKTEPQQLAG